MKTKATSKIRIRCTKRWCQQVWFWRSHAACKSSEQKLKFRNVKHIKTHEINRIILKWWLIKCLWIIYVGPPSVFTIIFYWQKWFKTADQFNFFIFQIFSYFNPLFNPISSRVLGRDRWSCLNWPTISGHHWYSLSWVWNSSQVSSNVSWSCGRMAWSKVGNLHKKQINLISSQSGACNSL